jgi:hypothetical protein
VDVLGLGVEVGLFKRGGEGERSGGCDGVIPFLLRIAKKMFIFGVGGRIRWRDIGGYRGLIYR